MDVRENISPRGLPSIVADLGSWTLSASRCTSGYYAVGMSRRSQWVTAELSAIGETPERAVGELCMVGASLAGEDIAAIQTGLRVLLRHIEDRGRVSAEMSAPRDERGRIVVGPLDV